MARLVWVTVVPVAAESGSRVDFCDRAISVKDLQSFPEPYPKNLPDQAGKDFQNMLFFKGKLTRLDFMFA